MTARRSERPTPGRVLSKATPARHLRRTPSEPSRKKSLQTTWPLFGQAAPSFPADPSKTVQDLAPPTSDLIALAASEQLPSDRARAAPRGQRSASLPPTAPEWMQAARALSLWLEERIARGSIGTPEQATISRAWAAFCLGGATEQQIHKVAHLVQRAHTAIRSSPRIDSDMQAAYHGAAGVLHASLPSAMRQRMPLERATQVVRRLREEADEWAAIVEGTAELLGWKDYARVHAAAMIRAVLEQQRRR